MAQDTADEGNNELDEELELLRAMWSSEEELEIQRSACAECRNSGDAAEARLIARLAPNTGGQEQRQYLRCEVVITVPRGYPGDLEHPVPPQVRLGASSGITDARRAVLLAALEELLQGDFAGLPGALPAVLETAQERLTTWNDAGPVGECPVCLAALDHGEGAAGLMDVSAAASLLRLPCYHVLHAACFAQFWEAEWLRQREEGERNRSTAGQTADLAVPEAVVACPECRQVAPWAAVPQIHMLLEHLSGADSKIAVVPKSGHRDEERDAAEGATAEADEAAAYTPYPKSHKDGGAAGFRQQQQQQQTSVNAKVDLFEVIMPRGLRTRVKPKWDARDQEGPVLRGGACGVVAEFVEGKDATYLRPEGMDYWLPLTGGRNNCKMVRIDHDMPRPSRAPSGWIHGEACLGADAAASASQGGGTNRAAKPAAASSPAEGRVVGRDRKKKTKGNDAGGEHSSASKLLGA